MEMNSGEGQMRVLAKDKLNSVYTRLANCIDRKIADFVDENGNLIPLHQLPKSARDAVESIEVQERTDKNGTFIRKSTLKLVPKATAMDMVLRIIGGYAESARPRAPSLSNPTTNELDAWEPLEIDGLTPSQDDKLDGGK